MLASIHRESLHSLYRGFQSIVGAEDEVYCNVQRSDFMCDITPWEL